MVERPIFYLHIPKTGGQTLASRLASSFLPERTWVLQTEMRHPADSDMLQRFAETKQFVEAHVSGELLMNDVSFDIMTTVREPIAQMIANYRHIRREPASLWHQASRQLDAGTFFDIFGDFFADHQTNYLLSALYPLSHASLREGRIRAYAGRLMEAVDRLRWLVPTESIDQFVGLWSVEVGRRAPSPPLRLNVAPDDDCNVKSLREVLLARPHLYAFDALLWQFARDRMVSYRKKIEAILVPWSWPDDSRRAFVDGASGIWLDEGWYDPEMLDGRLSWWAGPRAVSTVRLRRGAGEPFLLFDVDVVNGIEWKDIAAFAATDSRPLETVLLRVVANRGTYRVAIDSLADGRCSSALVVPDAMAPIMTEFGEQRPAASVVSSPTIGVWILARANNGRHP